MGQSNVRIHVAQEVSQVHYVEVLRASSSDALRMTPFAKWSAPERKSSRFPTLGGLKPGPLHHFLMSTEASVFSHCIFSVQPVLD